MPDGMKVDVEGNVYCGGAGGVWVLDPSGKHLGTIVHGQPATTNTVHPPGGATALIAVIGGEQIHQLGFWYVLAPAGLGALVLLMVALLVNNLSKDQRYPEYWF